uniref:Uncharacterized protein n=1 Tax=Anguilla anguilla TaxID=7936 RepID=A0A0E9SGX9_ANGAN
MNSAHLHICCFCSFCL